MPHPYKSHAQNAASKRRAVQFVGTARRAEGGVVSDETPDAVQAGQRYAMEIKRNPLEGGVPRGESVTGGGPSYRYRNEPTTIEYARDKPNEQDLLKQRVRQMDYDRRLRGGKLDDQDYASGRAERRDLQKRLKDLSPKGSD